MNAFKHSKIPIIGISSGLLLIDTGSYMGRQRVSIGHDYVEAIRLAGGLPIVLPIVEGEEWARQQLACIDGLLLSGGGDLSPFFYQEEPAKCLGVVCADRDRHEFQLLQAAKNLKKPILGICRGLQLINVAFGGSLYQDIDSAYPAAIQHYQMAKPDEPHHTVVLKSDTILLKMMGEYSLLTNSFHHQAIKNLAPGFIPNAHTNDGIIEGIEGSSDQFILAVQWHPELMFYRYPKMLKIFEALVHACKKSV